MLSILSTIAPIFLLIGLGYLSIKLGLMPIEHVPSLGRFVLYLCLPALIFSTLARTDVRTLLDPLYLLAYGAGSYLAFWLGFAVTRRWGSGSATDAGLNGLGLSLSNSAFVGYPVLLQVFGTLPAAAFSMTLVIENLLIMPTALIVLEMTRAMRGGRPIRAVAVSFVRRLLTQPILVSIVAGTVFSLSGLSLPEPVQSSLDRLAEAAAGVALFVIGGTLVGQQLDGDWRFIGAVSLGKLVLHPMLVAGLVLVLPPFDPTLQRIAILAAAMPMLSIYPVVASQYRDPGRYAATLVVTTLASFGTIAMVLALTFVES